MKDYWMFLLLVTILFFVVAMAFKIDIALEKIAADIVVIKNTSTNTQSASH